MPSSTGRRLRRPALLLAAIAAAGIVGTLALRPPPPPAIVGMVRATEVRIAPEVSGRIAALAVRVGDRVARGMVVAELANPELVAAVGEARASLALAQAARDRVYAGPRQEEVDIAAGEVDKAKAGLDLAQQQLARIEALASRGNAPQQRLDDARAAAAAAAADLRVVQARYAEARRGPTAEDRALADAGVAAAAASLGVLEQRLAKLTLRAPADGTVEVVVGEPGEAEIPGRTVLAITVAQAPWFSFNVREDQLHGLDVGTALTLVEPGSGKTIPARVTELRRLGDFATWRAARAVGDHDLNSFAVRADPTGDLAGARPGMTVRIAALR